MFKSSTPLTPASTIAIRAAWRGRCWANCSSAKTPAGILAGRIVETEAYLGQDDAAAHSAAGRRRATLFSSALRRAYVYFIYGNHYCLNVSCLPDGVPGGRPVPRSGAKWQGLELMAKARGIEIEIGSKIKGLATRKKISSGPGRLSEALGITRQRDNGKILTSARSDLRIVDDGYRVHRVVVTPRIGIAKSAERPCVT